MGENFIRETDVQEEGKEEFGEERLEKEEKFNLKNVLMRK